MLTETQQIFLLRMLSRNPVRREDWKDVRRNVFSKVMISLEKVGLVFGDIDPKNHAKKRWHLTDRGLLLAQTLSKLPDIDRKYAQYSKTIEWRFVWG